MATPLRILIGVTGGIAAYKIPLLIRILKKRGCEVKVVLTPQAQGFVGVKSLQTVSGNPVYLDNADCFDMRHISLSQWADLFLICPATANTIAKITHGIADNLLTSLALATVPEKIMIAPAMNSMMWSNPVTCHNIKTVVQRGVAVLPVGDGDLACGDCGPGRMIEIEEIAEYLFCELHNSALFRGKKVLISSGPTEEPLDPVRVLTNRSSGLMGAALARAAVAMGADVVMVSGPAKSPPAAGAKVIAVQTALQMKNAMEAEFQSCDICIMAAAVSDYRPVSYSTAKISRHEDDLKTLELVSNPDILAGLGKHKGKRTLVGFSLESDDNVERASQKMGRKNCDIMVLNRADISLETKSTQVTLLFANGKIKKFPVMDKSGAASIILHSIAELAGE